MRVAPQTPPPLTPAVHTWQVCIDCCWTTRPRQLRGCLPVARRRVGLRRPGARSAGSSTPRRSDLDAYPGRSTSRPSTIAAGAPFLTYFAYGDTRRRGMALVPSSRPTAAAGVESDDATSCPTTWRRPRVRRDRRPRRAPAAAARPSRRPGAAAPALSRRAARRFAVGVRGGRRARRSRARTATSEDAVRRLVAEGPPAEEVGLKPYRSTRLIPTSTGRTSRCRPIPVGAPRWTLPLGGRALPVPGRVRRRALLALPVRQVRLDHALVAALRGPAAATGVTAVPLRHPQGHGRPRHRAAGPRAWPDALGITEHATTWSRSSAGTSRG